MMKGGAATAVAPGYEFSLVVTSGVDKGAVFRLTGKKVSIGRSQDNAIQFPNDMKCSRHHAIIEFSDNGIEIENVSDNNHIEVDGAEVHRQRIKHGSIILIGETELQLRVKSSGGGALSPVGGGDLQAHQGAAPVAGPQFSNKATENTFSPNSRKSGPGFKILLVVLGLIFVYLLTSSPLKKKEITAIRTDEAVEAEIEKAKKLQEATISARNKSGKNSKQYESAQSAYVAGFRDYKQGNFGRALGAFQACLSLFPDHVLCNRYLRLSKRKFNELVQYHMILGRKYREQSQYSACRASFRNVMVMVMDANSAIYKEAKANHDACDTMLEDRY